MDEGVKISKKCWKFTDLYIKSAFKVSLYTNFGHGVE